MLSHIHPSLFATILYHGWSLKADRAVLKLRFHLKVISHHRASYSARTLKPLACLAERNVVSRAFASGMHKPLQKRWKKLKIEKNPTNYWLLPFIRSIIYLLEVFNALVITRQTRDKGRNSQYPSLKSDSVMTQVKKLSPKKKTYWSTIGSNFCNIGRSVINHCGGRMWRKFKGCSLKALKLLRGNGDGAYEWIPLSSAAAVL